MVTFLYGWKFFLNMLLKDFGSVKPETLESAINAACQRDTCFPLESKYWCKENPIFGHCALSAVAVQRIYGGEIIKDTSKHHYFNRLPDGKEFDLTSGQFPEGIEIIANGVSDEDYILNSAGAIEYQTAERFYKFQTRLIEELDKRLPTLYVLNE